MVEGTSLAARGSIAKAVRKARALRMANAAKGFRQPVQVMDGNFNRMPGVCPWWDQIKGQAVG